MKIKVTSVYVDDQDKARRFYTEVLGFAKKTDFSQGPYRWLTVASPEEPDGTELQLALNGKPPLPKLTSRRFVSTGPAGGDVLHRRRQGRLRADQGARGAEFTIPPKDVTGSTITMLNDTCGNLIQLTRWPAIEAKEKKMPGARAIHAGSVLRGADSKDGGEVDAHSRQRTAPLAGKSLAGAYRPGASARVGLPLKPMGAWVRWEPR